MRLVKDTNPGAYAVRVQCVGKNHDAPSRLFVLAKGYADLDGRAFIDYYCDKCADELPESCKVKREGGN